MKTSRFILIVIIVCGYSLKGNAQYDNFYMDNMVNQVINSAYMQINNNNMLIQQMNSMYQNEMIRMGKEVYPFFIPDSSTDSFGIILQFGNASLINQMDIYVKRKGDELKYFTSGSNVALGQYIILHSGFGNTTFYPGDKVLVVYEKKILKEAFIPLKSSSEYASFVQKAQFNLNYFSSSSNTGSGNSSSSSSVSGGKSSVTCKSCSGTGVCGTCKGKGYYYGSYTTDPIKCPNCSINDGRKCSVCSGTGKW